MKGSRTAHPLLRWQFEDVLDFECALAADTGMTDEARRTRDGRLYDESIAPSLPAALRSDRRAVFHSWVDARRMELDAVLPGQAYLSGWRTLLVIAAGGGLLLGAGLASPALLYQGKEPVNVIDFLGLILGPQYILLLLVLIAWLLRRTSLLPVDWHPIRSCTKTAIAIVSRLLRHLTGEQELKVRAIFGQIDRRREIYGSLPSWPLLVCTQVFAIAFNLGVLGVLLWNPVGHEKRFGWQTHYDGLRHNFPQFVSWLPYSGLTPEQVRETNYSPGDDAKKLPPEAARAWLPFLICTIGIWGLGVRAMLLAFVSLKLRRALNALPFDHADANALWRRLNGPLIKSQVPATSPAPTESAPFPTPALHGQEGSAMALVAAELASAGQFTEQDFRAQFLTFFRWHLKEFLPVKIDHVAACAAQLAEIQSAAAALVGLAVVIPAMRDPIMAILLFLEAVSRAAGERCDIVVLLMPEKSGAAVAGVDGTRACLWRNKTAAHGLRVTIETWRNQ